MFIGEAAGNNIPVSEFEFIYPVTPPIFDYETYIFSLEKLLARDLNDFKICYPHSEMRDNAHMMIKLGYEQITTWLRVFNSLYEDREKPDFLNLLMNELKKEDKIFAKFDQLLKDFQKEFPARIRGSIQGILRYIKMKRKKVDL